MTTVDDALTSESRELLGSRRPVFAVARVTREGTSVGALGAPLEGDYEIGSISKGVTGLLYVDALTRGEITPDTTVGEILPLAGSAAATVTLAALSTHTSGLPRLAKTSDRWRRGVALWRHGTNPYGDTLETVLEQARTVPVGEARPRYSNLGYMTPGPRARRGGGHHLRAARRRAGGRAGRARSLLRGGHRRRPAAGCREGQEPFGTPPGAVDRWGAGASGRRTSSAPRSTTASIRSGDAAASLGRVTRMRVARPPEGGPSNAIVFRASSRR